MVVAVGVAALGTFGAVVSHDRPKADCIAANVYFAGKSLSGLSLDQLNRVMSDWAAEHGGTQLELIAAVGPKMVSEMTTPLVLGQQLDVDKTVDNAYKVGRNLPFFQQVIRWLGGGKEVEIKPVWRWNEDQLGAYLRDSAQKWDVAAVNARVYWRHRHAVITPSQSGYEIDRPAAQVVIHNDLDDDDVVPKQITLPTIPAIPTVTTQQARKIDTILGEYKTYYPLYQTSRNFNMALACEKLNGSVVLPGDKLSYNQTVGPRTHAAGFRTAPVIINGQLVPGIGGGVCQVSSTLYNAGLLAGLHFPVRVHHDFPVEYLSAGRDATVAYGLIDLVMQNTTSDPIAISASTRYGRVTVRVLGGEDCRQHISLAVHWLKTWPAGRKIVYVNDLPPSHHRVIEWGHRGYLVSLWRYFWDDGRIVKRERVSLDDYQPEPDVIAVGAAKKAKEVKPAAKGLKYISTKPL